LCGRGFGQESFQKVLQSWCLFTKISFHLMARWLDDAMELPSLKLTTEARTQHTFKAHDTPSNDTRHLAMYWRAHDRSTLQILSGTCVLQNANGPPWL
jgi:hypothetical protein